ncbi:hypothetical protein KBZ21_40300 [Streptomyces sp. A73]|nr:hypothetical protein [Streptomyces sp. A73]
MPGTTDPRYYLPQEPADPGAEYLTIQETAREWHISGLCPPCFSRAAGEGSDA